MQKHVFIIGSKGIPARYGGFETFVDRLTKYSQNKKLKYHVACLAHDNKVLCYHNASCFHVRVPELGQERAVYYDCIALERSIRYCQKNGIKAPVFYILACRIGFFIKYYKKRIHELGGVLYVNPDGHEWKRKKWNLLIRAYWKASERRMVQNADYVICDSRMIQKYIGEEYEKWHPQTKYIAYGAEAPEPNVQREGPRIEQWLKERNIERGQYYLMVGRFVAENNFETIIREYMKSDTDKKLVIITGQNSRFLQTLKKRTGYEKDNRICFSGTVYHQQLLYEIRKNAFAYIHGHEVGGTNPSLLEALAATDINLLLNVDFNVEVGSDAALYWTKSEGNLSTLINRIDLVPQAERARLGILARKRIEESYKWESIAQQYEKCFLSAGGVVES